MHTTKEQYLREFKARIEQTENEIEELMARATRSDYDEHLTSIRAKQEIAKAKLAELRKASDENLWQVRAELERSVSEVENGLLVATADSG